MKEHTAAFLTTIFIFLLFSPVLNSTVSRAQSSQSMPEGSQVDGLQLSLVAVGTKNQGSQPEIQLTFMNIGSHDLTLNLGAMLANGKVLLPTNVSLNFTDPQGQTRIFKFGDKKYPAVAGRMDDYVVPLRIGSSYTLRLTLDQFWCPETKEFEVKLLPGVNQLRAQFEGTGAKLVNLDMPAIKHMNFWQGRIESNTITISE